MEDPSIHRLWLAGQSITNLSPCMLVVVNLRTIKTLTVVIALPHSAWIIGITGTLATEAIIQFLHLVDIVVEQELQPDTQDTITWNLSQSDNYTAKSAYKAFFEGSYPFPQFHLGVLEPLGVQNLCLACFLGSVLDGRETAAPQFIR
jgi:hypothetical protein